MKHLGFYSNDIVLLSNSIVQGEKNLTLQFTLFLPAVNPATRFTPTLQRLRTQRWGSFPAGHHLSVVKLLPGKA
jgi:hypothetical protein